MRKLIFSLAATLLLSAAAVAADDAAPPVHRSDTLGLRVV